MIRKIGKTVATIIGGIIPAFTLMLVMSSIAWALSGGTGVAMKNGQIGLTDGSGGIATGLPEAAYTLLGGAAEGDIFVVNGSSQVVPLTKGSDNYILKMNGSNPGWEAETSADYSKSTLVFTSETKIDLADNTTPVFIGLGGRVSSTESDVATPIDAGKFTNLYCRSNVTLNTTNGVTVTLRIGACGSEADTTVLKDVIGTAAVGYTGTAVAATAGQCISLSAVRKTSGNPVAGYINCTLQKTANS